MQLHLLIDAESGLAFAATHAKQTLRVLLEALVPGEHLVQVGQLNEQHFVAVPEQLHANLPAEVAPDLEAAPVLVLLHKQLGRCHRHARYLDSALHRPIQLFLHSFGAATFEHVFVTESGACLDSMASQHYRN